MWCVQRNPHDQARKRASNWNSRNPREAEQTHTLPVDRLVVAIAQAHANSCPGYAHRRRDRKFEMLKMMGKNQHVSNITGEFTVWMTLCVV
jgi:hypothetical protein